MITMDASWGIATNVSWILPYHSSVSHYPFPFSPEKGRELAYWYYIGEIKGQRRKIDPGFEKSKQKSSRGRRFLHWKRDRGEGMRYNRKKYF